MCMLMHLCGIQTDFYPLLLRQLICMQAAGSIKSTKASKQETTYCGRSWIGWILKSLEITLFTTKKINIFITIKWYYFYKSNVKGCFYRQIYVTVIVTCCFAVKLTLSLSHTIDYCILWWKTFVEHLVLSGNKRFSFIDKHFLLCFI